MDPRFVTAEMWEQINRLAPLLGVFAGLALNGALAALLAAGIVPSLRDTGHLALTDDGLRPIRLALYAIAAACLALAIWAGAHALLVAVEVSLRIFPRIAI